MSRSATWPARATLLAVLGLLAHLVVRRDRSADRQRGHHAHRQQQCRYTQRMYGAPVGATTGQVHAPAAIREAKPRSQRQPMSSAAISTLW